MGKKVGLVTCYFKNNYGSMLQAYATKKFLDNNQIENETINIDYNKDFKKGKREYYLTQITNFKFIKNKSGMIKLKFQKKLNKELGKNIAIRNRKYKEFRREINLSRSNNNYIDLTNQAKELYTDVVVGSDQLWLPVNVVSDYYTLNWVPDDINKVSYSTSFGFSSIPKKYNEMYKKFLSRINHLSTREESGVKIIKDITNKDAKLVCDPTILLTKEEWQKEIKNEPIYKEKYILCYFLGNNIEHRKFAERLKEKAGYKIVSLNHSDEYVKYSDTFCDYSPFDVGPKEWINLIENAEYICTDSFHGTVFSILFNKKFFDFRRHNNKSKVSTNSRIDSLLDVAGISKERILTGTEDIDEVLKYKIDYDKVNKNIDKFRKDSGKWFLNSLTWKKDEKKHINITVKEDCCGCSACYNICPVNAIEMCEDNEGFKYPKVDEEKCIKCGKCLKVCKIKNPINEQELEQKGYILQHKDEKVLKESTSGGAFTAIGQYIIKNGGVVFGAAFDENFEVKHTYVEKEKDLEKFRNSKYVQSDASESYKKVKEFLDKGRLTCFSGTPCQVEGLKSYLNLSGKDYATSDKLCLVDIICRSVPSHRVMEVYKGVNLTSNEKIRNLKFRDKSPYGYDYSQMSMTTNKKKIHNGVESDIFLRAFFHDLSVRPSCYSCKFKKRYRESDITMWDCFNVYDFDKEFDNNKGATRIITHSKKGEEIIENVKKSGIAKVKEFNPDRLVKGSKELVKSTKYNSNRKEFFEDLNNMIDWKNAEEVFKENNKDSNEFNNSNFEKFHDECLEFTNKWFKDTAKVKAERVIRHSTEKLGIYSKVKKTAKKVLKR